MQASCAVQAPCAVKHTAPPRQLATAQHGPGFMGSQGRRSPLSQRALGVPHRLGSSSAAVTSVSVCALPEGPPSSTVLEPGSESGEVLQPATLPCHTGRRPPVRGRHTDSLAWCQRLKPHFKHVSYMSAHAKTSPARASVRFLHVREHWLLRGHRSSRSVNSKMGAPEAGSWLRHGVPDLPDDLTKVPWRRQLAHHMRTRHFFGSLAVLLAIAVVLLCCRVDMQVSGRHGGRPWSIACSATAAQRVS